MRDMKGLDFILFLLNTSDIASLTSSAIILFEHKANIDGPAPLILQPNAPAFNAASLTS